MRFRARGPRPRFFADPELDRFHVMLVALLGEVSVLRDRLDAVERVLDSGRPFTRADLEAYEPDAAAAAEREAERSALVERVLRVVLEDGAEADTGYATVEDVVATVSAPHPVPLVTPGRKTS
ncbi:hypothetical protein [Pseudonocardia pini]|uniref:hypothetical protein n=1 Tax=Pseudonocardia pini TaxID=2758030 RepID=UPI0015F00AEC|nr:hypothetical protein [Pseudonocardia pini]